MINSTTVEQKRVSDLSSKDEESLHPKEKSSSEGSTKVTSESKTSKGSKDVPKETEAKKVKGDDKEQASTEMLSISEITDGITEKLNSVLMEMNKSDKEIDNVLVGIDGRLDKLEKAFK